MVGGRLQSGLCPAGGRVLAPVGFVLPMSVGAILMSVSTVVVALDAQLLRRLDLTPARSTARLAGADTTECGARAAV